MPKEYIERNDLIKNLNEFAPEHYNALINNLITKQPAADVVEVVRCKNCKWAMELTESEERIYTNDCVMCSQIHPDGHRIAMLRNSFCSYGEKKDGST